MPYHPGSFALLGVPEWMASMLLKFRLWHDLLQHQAASRLQISLGDKQQLQWLVVLLAGSIHPALHFVAH
jgi:hypothetical protein